MFAVRLDHYIFDDPYKQTSVKKGLANLEKYVNEQLDDYLFFTVERRDRSDFVSLDLTDEIVTIYHTAELTLEQKQIIVGYVREIVTLKKSVYKNEVPHLCIMFEKKNEDDCFIFFDEHTL